MKTKCDDKDFKKRMSCKHYFAGMCLIRKPDKDYCQFEKKIYMEGLTYDN